MNVYKAEYLGKNFDDETVVVDLIVVAEDEKQAKNVVENHSATIEEIPPENFHKINYIKIDLSIPHLADIDITNIS